MTDDASRTTTVTVPRWALDYLLQHADCEDAGGHQSSEMIAARYHLELAMEGPATPSRTPKALRSTYERLSRGAPQMTTAEKIAHVAVCMDVTEAKVGAALVEDVTDTHETAPPQNASEFAVWEHGRRQGIREGMRAATRQPPESYLASQCPAADAPSD